MHNKTSEEKQNCTMDVVINCLDPSRWNDTASSFVLLKVEESSFLFSFIPGVFFILGGFVGAFFFLISFLFFFLGFVLAVTYLLVS